jgi:site-specific recombinase XerD
MNTPISLAALLERFFTQRLMQQRHASPHTISSYRDTFHQFLKFTEQRLRKEPSRLNFQEIDAPLITAFLDHLEKHQGLSTRSRNLRLTAMRSFFRFRSFRGTDSFRTDPTGAGHPQQAFYPDLGPISHTCRSRCLVGRSGSTHMVWPA